MARAAAARSGAATWVERFIWVEVDAAPEYLHQSSWTRLSRRRRFYLGINFGVDDERFEEFIEVGPSTRVDVLIRIEGNKSVEGATVALHDFVGREEGRL